MSRQPRPIRIEGDVAYVPLTKGYEAVIDAADVPLVAGWRWGAKVRPWTTYAARTDYSTGRKVEVKMHRLLMAAPAHLLVDHRDRNGLNNRRGNLRLATSAQNARNAGVNKNSLTGIRGVGWVARDSKWRARISCNGQSHLLGHFNCITAARLAYARASVKMHGEFGRAV